jgi:hypothetical protein
MCKQGMLQALCDVQKFLDWIQGTSPNETWHSALNRYLHGTGGGRSYQLIFIAVCLREMDFNGKKLKRIKFGSDRKAAQRSAIGEALQLGLDRAAAAQAACALRTSWHEFMEAHHDVEDLQRMGFRRKTTVVGATLDTDTLDRLYVGLQRLVTNEEFDHTQDPAYYVAHHIAERTLTTLEVKPTATSKLFVSPTSLACSPGAPRMGFLPPSLSVSLGSFCGDVVLSWRLPFLLLRLFARVTQLIVYAA